MIRGRFGDTTGRPYLEARVEVLDRHVDVSFIVDTGADATLLSPGDAERLGLDPGLFGPRDLSIGGLGKGSAKCARTSALITFTDDEYVWVYTIALAIGFRDDLDLRLPSLLGRDILDRWRMTYDPAHPETPTLEFEARTADHLFRLLEPEI